MLLNFDAYILLMTIFLAGLYSSSESIYLTGVLSFDFLTLTYSYSESLPITFLSLLLDWYFFDEADLERSLTDGDFFLRFCSTGGLIGVLVVPTFFLPVLISFEITRFDDLLLKTCF